MDFKRGFLDKSHKGDNGKKRESDHPNRLSARDAHLIGFGLEANEYKYSRGKSTQDMRMGSETGKEDTHYERVKETPVEESLKGFIHREFQRIGGNVTSPDEARIICLGDNHLNEKHTELNAQLINHIARVGDMVLLEDVPAGQACDQRSHKKTIQLTKRMQVVGWDNPELIRQAIDIGKQHLEIADKLSSGKLDQEEYTDLYNKQQELKRQEHAINLVERNKGLGQVIHAMKERFPDRKIFVLAGINHFEQDSNFTSFLNKDSRFA